MNDNITTDGVSRITSSVAAFGYGNALNGVLDTSNAWKVDSHGAFRDAEAIEAIHGTEVAVEKTGAAAALATEKNGAANQLATEKTSAAVQLANSLAFANTQNLLISGFKDGRFDAAVNAAAVALAGATNTAAILAAQEACCCDLKEKIGDDGQKTRDLINSIQSTNLAVELADAKNQLVTVSSAAHAAEQTSLINAIINAFSTGILPTGLKKSV